MVKILVDALDYGELPSGRRDYLYFIAADSEKYVSACFPDIVKLIKRSNPRSIEDIYFLDTVSEEDKNAILKELSFGDK